MPKPKATSRPTGMELDVIAENREFSNAIEQGLEPLADSPALNRMLLRKARNTLNDIAQQTGLPVGEVAERLTELLDNTGWRDDLMEEKLLLAEVGLLVDDIRARMTRTDMDDEAWASMARVQLAAVKTLMEQLDKRRKAVDGQLALVTTMQAQLFAEAIKIAQERAILNIERKYPDLNVDIIYEEFEAALPHAIDYLESQARDG